MSNREKTEKMKMKLFAVASFILGASSVSLLFIEGIAANLLGVAGVLLGAAMIGYGYGIQNKKAESSDDSE